jgi:hypothetical protein
MQKGEGNLNERTSDREDDDKQGSQAKDEDSAASSADRAKEDRAKEREREMEESGEENAQDDLVVPARSLPSLSGPPGWRSRDTATGSDSHLRRRRR